MVKTNIPALTGLRLFAALAIVLWHLQAPGLLHFGLFKPFNLAGAVPVFFVLSGFVLTLGSDRYKSRMDFLAARFARIWPTHIAAILFYVALFYPWSMYFIEDHKALLLDNAAMLQAWCPDQLVYWSFNEPSWSISCEVFFYATFPLLLPLLRERPIGRAAFICGGIALAVLSVGAFAPKIDPVWLGVDNPISGLVAFIIGIATAVLWKRMAPARDRSAVVGSALQVSAVAMAAAANIIGYWAASHASGPEFFIANYGPAPAYAALIFALSRYRGIVSWSLSRPIIVYGGEISFAMYLFHQLIIRFYGDRHAALGIVSPWEKYGIIFTLTILVSMVAHHLVERPARTWILGLWRMGRVRLTPAMTVPPP